MKTVTSLAISVFIAGTIVVLQPFVTYAADEFVLSDDQYKIFSYGFPFRIVDCSGHLAVHMSGLEQGIRISANFAVTFVAVALLVRALRGWSTRRHQRCPA